MAERRSVRSSSRRITPTAQPLSTAASPQHGRIVRKRVTRTASREVESAPPTTRRLRRSARQASVTSESEHKPRPTARRPKRGERKKEAVGNLTIVEEVEMQNVQIGTPPRQTRQSLTDAQRSPGALSQMSGTTAISSFTSLEAEMLDVAAILRQLPKLYSEATEFLDHLAPAGSINEVDVDHIKEMRKPDSDFNQTFRELDQFFDLRLAKFRGEDQQYIRLGAIHRALLGPDRDPSTMWSGVDLIIYLANIAIFAKSMIGSDRNEPEMWGALRELDGSLFPRIFLSSLNEEAGPSPTGESSLLEPTFELALQLRVQLAIQVLGEASERENFNPDETLEEVFLHTEDIHNLVHYRGWAMPGIGGESEDLPRHLRDRVSNQMEKIRKCFLTDTQSLERGHLVDFEELDKKFPWMTMILQLLDWVRSRHAEIQTAIESLNGINGISEQLRAEMQQPNPVPLKPRKSRVSFGEHRHRGSRKFDPHANRVDAAVSILKGKRADETIPSRAVSSGRTQPVRAAAPARGRAVPTEDVGPSLRRNSSKKSSNNAAQQVVTDTVRKEALEDELYEAAEDDVVEQVVEDNVGDISVDDQMYEAPEDDTHEQAVEDNLRDESVEEQVHQAPKDNGFEQVANPEPVINEAARPAKPSSSHPPSSTADFLREFNERKRADKENDYRRRVDPQENIASAVHGDRFGDDDDYDDEMLPTRPGPSQTAKDKQPAQAPARKRGFDSVEESDDEEDAFESVPRGTIAQERRRRAPVAKKARLGPSSSAPTSHQPRPRTVATVSARAELEESLSESDAPEMTDEPPRSTLADVKQLARINSSAHALQRRQGGRGRVAWTDEQEQELVKYMAMYPQQYAMILKEDLEGPEARQLLQGRSQVNLKDKARNLATTFIKSGTGIKKGFESVVQKNTRYGQQLLDQGYDW